MYVEELIGPDTVNTMPDETIARVPGSRRGRGDTGARGRRRGASALLDELREAGVDYDDVVETLEAEGVQKFADSFDGAARRHPREARAARSPPERDASSRRARRADLGARPDRLDRQRRGAMARLARRAAADARARRPLLRFAEQVVGRLLDDVVLLGMGGSSLAPEVIRQTFGVERVPRARHDASGGDPRRSRATLDLERTLFIAASKSGSTIETRSHLEYFWEQGGGGRALRRHHRSGLRRSSSSRPSAASAPSSPASRRSAAATRRSRRSGWCRPR